MEVFKRTERVGELIRIELAEIFKKDVNDPRLALLSVTHVEVSPDLKHAMVYISPIKQEEVETITECLKKARGFIQKRLGRKLKLRYTPVLEFRIDESIKRGAHILEILETLKREKTESENG